jgi:hypothetical protein
MSRTRKYVERRRKATRRHRRRHVMKGGGKLDRLPIGPDAREADGTPKILRIPAGSRLGSTNAYNSGRARSKTRIQYLNSPPADWTPEKMLKHVVATTSLLPSNVRSTYLNKANYDGVVERATEKYAELISTGLAGNALPEAPSLESVIKGVKDDLENKWDYKYVCGHGVLTPELPPAIVPARTYVRFHSPAGCLATITGEKTGLVPIMAFPEIFVQTKKAFIDDMADHYFSNTGPLESFSSKAERDELIRNPYPDEFCRNPRDPFTESKLCLAPGYTKQTIYMPGESIPQMKINFANNPYQILILGVYDLPMNVQFYTAVQHIAENYTNEKTKELHEMSDPELKTAIADQHALDTLLFQHDSIPFIDNGTKIQINNVNLCKDIIGSTLTLTEIFSKIPAVPEGKVRFLFINSCRGVPRVMNDTGLAANVLGAWGAGAAAGGAGAPPSKRPLNIAQRKELAVHARRLSLGAPQSTNDQALLERVVEARKYMGTHPITDPERARKSEFEGKIMMNRPDIWGMAVTMVPKSDPPL